MALLLGAWVFQSIGYAPCAMCIWQRYPHAIAIFLGALVFFGLRHKVIYLVGAIATASTAGIGIFHTGVERDWWEGPTSCTGSGLDLTTMTPEDLLSTSGVADLVMCDQVSWEFLTLSMASWNTLLSCVLVGLWIIASKQGKLGSGLITRI
ncbi:disulfide bond formation protein DsbB [Litoreibacter halocynthiae]|uniref:Disulfide bond formation protein DsbB n=1 Tax=Litoreibacter halocynthiae TaxID=1242689 RepID=A0A4R7LB71_9RHOB|nr:disulfide bond formation protein DsbB [Litoreibacter halocynthiae]